MSVSSTGTKSFPTEPQHLGTAVAVKNFLVSGILDLGGWL
jgi:hypothetical protein